MKRINKHFMASREIDGIGILRKKNCQQEKEKKLLSVALIMNGTDKENPTKVFCRADDN